VATDEPGCEERPAAQALLIVGIVVFLAGFVWLWWTGVPTLYRGVNDISPADRLKAITDTRPALLASAIQCDLEVGVS
jgi:hypothetical protein